ncbi:MAG: S-methyl-5-thioribose-1-phosphate isomerase [Desulfarculaceae bacterium]|nr:S-methyl-5-thioribose-1-phosphate isomerase [Desulfarculaceae bacterium]MCF8065383.1 S-methyl-5-thioribose-1-phosphate isomerase [Desulfarculaceae bacterium]MCF8099035.1 S-methyl-5-thioribose-1-phosphate isomerase [Desulfarculaceae bacterium]MCF8124314.1 S-methyl-5-thioribose-1-phosphate isomerase [Desulfarculaceae bacterium]
MILDQRKLPSKTTFIACRDMKRVIYCIQTLAVRGAPAIGIAASMGLVLAAKAIRVKDPAKWRQRFAPQAEVMRAARPTAVNLGWAVDRMLAIAATAPDDVPTILAMLRRESEMMLAEDVAINRAMGRHGNKLVPKRATILTHCNAGSLATGGYGTALGVVRAAAEAGKKIKVIADETRPLLQGARLTAWEMVDEGIPVAVAPDGAVGALMSKGLVDLCVVGADRIAANGDVANKIGTFNVALQARRHGVPFYVAAPLSTIDMDTPSGDLIPIEERDPAEVLAFAGSRAAPGAEAINLAFDVTPNDLVSAIITEVGVLRPPFNRSLAAAKAQSLT